MLLNEIVKCVTSSRFFIIESRFNELPTAESEFCLVLEKESRIFTVT